MHIEKPKEQPNLTDLSVVPTEMQNKWKKHEWSSLIFQIQDQQEKVHQFWRVKQETISNFRDIMNEPLSEIPPQIFIYFQSCKRQTNCNFYFLINMF